ncbi:hypothetical protein SAMN05443529_1131 [Desulfosporosinus hippei DSM 8344]|uniref:Uncharacterized protein n=1 Tax=Desulfosporosinus hippei DSM 8344 TaxID=1121419 RepID=A0A1G8C459_9FIRM|nr:hypothetical protein SAMN05443529_1131 [Desulfosporosinus hippei DSM 8344]
MYYFKMKAISLWPNSDPFSCPKTDQFILPFTTGGGHDSTRYTKAEFLENPGLVKQALQDYSRFVLCNDDNVKGIRILIDKELLVELENKFGNINYRTEDFKNYDKLYYIYVDSPSGYTDSDDGKEILEVFDNPIVYMGCIFVVNNKLYYGNMNNNITGELADMLKNIIGS